MQRCVWFILSAALAVAAPSRIKVRITWGHQAPQAAPYYLRLVPANGAGIENAAGYSLEPGEGQSEDAWQSRAGAGDIAWGRFDAGRSRRACRRASLNPTPRQIGLEKKLGSDNAPRRR